MAEYRNGTFASKEGNFHMFGTDLWEAVLGRETRAVRNRDSRLACAPPPSKLQPAKEYMDEAFVVECLPYFPKSNRNF